MKISIWVGYINKTTAPKVARKLREMGYDVKNDNCVGYAVNIARRVEPMDSGARLRVLDAIAEVAGFYPA